MRIPNDHISGKGISPWRRYGHFILILSCAIVTTLGADAGAVRLRTVAQLDSEPKFIVAAGTGKPAVEGLCVDIFRAIERIDPGIVFDGDQTWTPPARVDAYLEDGIIDVACGFILNSERQGKFIALQPSLLNFHYVLVARMDDHVSIADWKDVIKLGNDNTVLAVQGMGPSRQLKEIPGLPIDEGSRTILQNLYKLEARRGRFFYYRRPGLHALLKKYCFENKLRILPTMMNNFPLYMMAGKHLPPAVIAALESDLSSLRDNGTLDRLESKWLSYDPERIGNCAADH
jgi:glutamate/aspartate transport system substrate-binding protein